MITKENLWDALDDMDFFMAKDKCLRHFEHSNSDICVDIEKGKIIYPTELEYNRATTLNFSKNENFVVLDCIVRLLEIGYKPEQIKLEESGYIDNKAGYCDILVSDNMGKEYMIIECKTTEQNDSDEFAKEWSKMKKSGGQLFNYFNTFRRAQYLVLYTCDYTDKLIPIYHVISLCDNMEYLKTNLSLMSYDDVRREYGGYRDYFEVWKNTYQQDYSTNGVFEKEIKPFAIGEKKLSSSDLVEIDAYSMQKKYHQYATILRQYNVSSKENAFDKLINLFLAKIIDEKYNGSELKCYWRGAAYDNYYDLHDRLHELYKVGMEEFFQDQITYVENKKVEDAFKFLVSKADVAKETILGYFRELKYFNNNPFSILDVHNEELFQKNAVILKEIVRMIQDIKLSSKKQNQFLGDLFEGFLDQGIKQSEGQFFTPIPIVRFMISSLPVASLVNGREIPKVIDYACGAGHFLTEFASQITNYVRTSVDIHEYYKNIIGIEKEYRLSKVSQVSVYMYGQDGIKIRYSDALSQNIADVKNGTYSVLVANPPYSVKGFMETLSDTDLDSYTLTRLVSDRAKNNAIETFFIERAEQLLKENGIAAIILPSSILNKGGVYAASREIILKKFDIFAIVNLGSGTFGKTGTNTVILFLRRRARRTDLAKHCLNRVNEWFMGNDKDDEVYADRQYLQDYCDMMGIEVSAYRSLMERNPSEELLKQDIFRAYREAFDLNKKNVSAVCEKAKEIRTKIKIRSNQKTFKKLHKDEQQKEIWEACMDFIREIEKEKLFYYLLTRRNKREVLIINSPSDNKKQKNFLGYEWSSSKGNEGIKYLNTFSQFSDDETDDNTMEQIKGVEGIVTPLFDPSDLGNEEKINSLIRHNFNEEDVAIPKELEEFVTKVYLSDMIDFKTVGFDKALRTTGLKELTEYNGNYKLYSLNMLAPFVTNKIKFSDIDSSDYVTTDNMLKNKEGILEFSGEAQVDKVTEYKKGDVLVSNIRPYLKKIWMADRDGGCSNDVLVFRVVNRSELLPEYLYTVLKQDFFFEYVMSTAKGMKMPRGDKKRILDFKIPIPSLKKQKEIIDEFKKIDVMIKEKTEMLEKYDVDVKMKFSEMFSREDIEKRKLGTIGKVSMCKRIFKKETAYSGDIPFYKIGTFGKKADAYITREKYEEYKEKYPYPKKGDVLISAAGTVGTVVAFDGEPAYFQDSNIVWIDNDESVLLNKFLEIFYLTEPWIISEGGTIKRLYNDDIENIIVPIPSLSMQNEFLDYVKLMDQSKAEIQAAIRELKSEREKLVEKYFR